jgi:5-methylcytosine-specific restriction enzyme subunit McrC
MEEVTLKSHLTIAEASASILTRLNQRFSPLLNLALLFLEGGALQLKAGDTRTFAFTFDMNKLFEAFIVNFISHHREDILPAALSTCELLPQSNMATRYLARSRDRRVFLLKPDLVFRQNNQFPLIMDAKYKRLDSTNSRLGISEADFYQMHAYAHSYSCPHVILIYPQTAEMSQPIRGRFEVEGTKISVVAATVNLQVALQSKEGRTRIIKELRGLLLKDGDDERRSTIS